MAQTSRSFTPSYEKFVRIAAIFVIAIGCLVLIGWTFNIVILKSVLPGLVTMKANSALGFVLAGISLFLGREKTNSPQRHIGLLCSTAVTGLGLFNLWQYSCGWELGIDEFLFKDDPEPIGTFHPGRMSPVTAFSFSAIGIAIGLTGIKKGRLNSHEVIWVEILAILTNLLAAQALIAYIYGVKPIVGSIPYTQMALHTAFCFLLLGVSVLLTHINYGPIGLITANSMGGVTARRLLPAAIAIPLLLGWLRIVSERIGLFHSEFGSSIVALLHAIAFVAIVFWNARLLHRIDLQRQSAVEALYQANDELEAKVEQRTAQLRESNQRLRQSEERLSLAIEGVGMATWDLNLRTGKLVWSEQHFRILGYQPIPNGEVTIEMWSNRVHPEDVERIEREMERAKQERSLYNTQYRIMRADNGQITWLRAFGRFLYDENGEAVRFVGIFFDTSGSKRIEEERDRFFTLSLDMLSIAGFDGYFKRINPAFEKVLGYTEAELLSRPYIDFIHPQDKGKTIAEGVKISRGSPGQYFENRYLCKDGTYKWLAWTSVPSVEERLTYAVARDVTERKQAEQQLEQQAATLQRQADLLELVYEAIVVRNAEGEITYWNQGAEAMYGWTREEALGQVTHHFLQTQLSEPAANLDKLLLQEERWYGELIHTCKGGRQMVVESRQVLIRDRDGTPTGFLEVNRDITERKQTETTLRNLNQELQRLLTESQTLLDVIPIGIGIAEDPKCQHIRINPAFAELLGIPSNANASLSAPNQEKPIGFKVYQNDRELLPEELPLQYAATHGVEVLDLEVDIVRDDGKVFTLLEYASPLFDERGQPRGSIGAFLDITDRKRAEAEVRQLNAELEQRVEKRTAQLQQANEELESFSYTVAHDLRAPLRGIQSYTLALLEDYEDNLDEMARDYIQHIFASIDRMNALVQDLLAYSRLSREAIKLTPVNLNQVLAEAQLQVESELRDRQAEITLTQPLPSVMGHRPTLIQMVVNLLSNASKFVASSVTPQIRIWAEEKADRVRLWVEDNGIGIESQYHNQIFGVFEQLHPRDTYPGTGIGLAIVRKGAERLGGSAGVESTLGDGSRFWVELQGVKP